jgi:tetratricopeptide (TPR) repeat protein
LQLISEITAATPALVVLDDVQWADEASLLLLKHLVRTPQDVAALFVVTCRDTELGSGHPFIELVSDLSRDRLVHRLQLIGLDEPDAGSLFESLVGFEPNRDLIHHVTTGTRGNPYFVEEVAYQIRDRHHGADDKIWGAKTLETLGVPAGVRVVSERRLERLSNRTRDLLAIAAIIGEQFDHEVLAAVAGVDAADLLDVMDEAVTAGLLQEMPNRIGSYTFSHALIRQTLLEGRSLNRKAALHARVGEALEALHQPHLRPVLSDLAHHFSRAGRHCVAKAVRYGREAGEEALAMLAHEDAVTRFQESLAALDTSFTRDDATRAELLVLLGVALNRAGDVTAARAAFEEGAELAKAAGAAETMAKAAMGYGSVSGFGGVWYTYAVVDEVLVRLIESALDARSATDEPTRALLLGSLAQALYWSPDSERMVRLSGDALDMARRLGDPAVLAHALDSRHVALWNPDTLAERTELANAMLRLAEEVGDRDLRLEAFSWLITDTLESGQIEMVDKYIDAHTRLAEELRQPYHLWYTAAVKAMRAFQRGDYETTDRLVEEAWKHGQRAHGANAEQTYLVQKLFVGRELDQLAPMVPALAAYVEHTPLVYGWRCALAFAYAETGHRAEAISQLEFLAGDGFSRLRLDCIWLATLSMLVQVIARFEVTDHAGTLYRLLQPYEGRRIVVGGAVLCFGPVSRVLGALARVEGRLDDALGHLDQALAEAQEDDTPPIQARIQLEIATVLCRRGHPGDELRAATSLDEAEAIASKLGMTSLLRDIGTQRDEMPSARPD